MKQILDILNPVHEPSVSEWMQIAAIIVSNNISTRRVVLDIEAIQLMQRWEELTNTLLTKEMFVCEVMEPSIGDYYISDNGYRNAQKETYYEDDLAAYQAAQEKVLFEGFEIGRLNNSTVFKGEFELWFQSNRSVRVWFTGEDDVILYDNPTLSDLITEITRYNRTATKPIEIKWTPNVIKKLLA